MQESKVRSGVLRCMVLAQIATETEVGVAIGGSDVGFFPFPIQILKGKAALSLSQTSGTTPGGHIVVVGGLTVPSPPSGDPVGTCRVFGPLPRYAEAQVGHAKCRQFGHEMSREG